MNVSEEATTIEQAMDRIKTKGYFCSGQALAVLSKQLLDKVESGELTTLDKLGIKYMNESYFYVLVGNPDNVRVFQERNFSYLGKGSKS